MYKEYTRAVPPRLSDFPKTLVHRDMPVDAWPPYPGDIVVFNATANVKFYVQTEVLTEDMVFGELVGIDPLSAEGVPGWTVGDKVQVLKAMISAVIGH